MMYNLEIKDKNHSFQNGSTLYKQLHVCFSHHAYACIIYPLPVSLYTYMHMFHLEFIIYSAGRQAFLTWASSQAYQSIRGTPTYTCIA